MLRKLPRLYIDNDIIILWNLSTAYVFVASQLKLRLEVKIMNVINKIKIQQVWYCFSKLMTISIPRRHEVTWYQTHLQQEQPPLTLARVINGKFLAEQTII